jgi:hypothetical protein
VSCRWDGLKPEPPGADPRANCEIAFCTFSDAITYGGSWSSRAGGTMGTYAAGCFCCNSYSVEALAPAFRWGSNALAARPRSPSRA